MVINLSEHLEAFVRKKVPDGVYADLDEATTDAVAQLQADQLSSEQKLARLQEMVATARESAARDGTLVLNSDEQIDAYFDALDAR